MPDDIHINHDFNYDETPVVWPAVPVKVDGGNVYVLEAQLFDRALDDDELSALCQKMALKYGFEPPERLKPDPEPDVVAGSGR